MRSAGTFLALLLLALTFLACPSAQARPIDADLDVRSVDIDHSFSGMDLLLYGARNETGRIVVVLRGPEKRYLVRRKERIGGIWVNRKSVEFDHVPGFYAAASVAPTSTINNPRLLDALGVGSGNIPFEVSGNQKGLKSDTTVNEFRDALADQLEKSGLYRNELSPVSFMGETLFRTWLEFPKNILRGWYTAEVFLFTDGQLTSVQTIPISVSKIGFEAFTFDFAHKRPLIYGLLCVLMALAAGWGGNRMFRRG